MSGAVSSRIGDADFQATSDPAVLESADQGTVQLLDYRQLFELWERQRWSVQAIDFTQDRVDWHEKFTEQDRYRRMYTLSTFFAGERSVSTELGPIIRATPDPMAGLFLCTQIADEAQHVAFFDRFYREVGVLEADELTGRLEETSDHLNDSFHQLFDEMLGSRVDRLGTASGDHETLVEAITLYHMVIEGMLALTGQHVVIARNESEGTLPGLVEGFNLIARDEHRHVAFGTRFLREMALADDRYRAAIQRTLEECGPAVAGVLRPPWYEEAVEEQGEALMDAREFAARSLQRRLKVMGLIPSA